MKKNKDDKNCPHVSNEGQIGFKHDEKEDTSHTKS